MSAVSIIVAIRITIADPPALDAVEYQAFHVCSYAVESTNGVAQFPRSALFGSCNEEQCRSVLCNSEGVCHRQDRRGVENNVVILVLQAVQELTELVR